MKENNYFSRALFRSLSTHRNASDSPSFVVVMNIDVDLLCFSQQQQHILKSRKSRVFRKLAGEKK